MFSIISYSMVSIRSLRSEDKWQMCPKKKKPLYTNLALFFFVIFIGLNALYRHDHPPKLTVPCQTLERQQCASADPSSAITQLKRRTQIQGSSNRR